MPHPVLTEFENLPAIGQNFAHCREATSTTSAEVYAFLISEREAVIVGDWSLPAPASTVRANDPLRESIDKHQLLPVDWDGQGADPPNQTAAANAELVVDVAREFGLVPDRVVPSVEGGLGVYFRRGRRYGLFECLNTGEVAAVYSDGTGSPAAWDLHPERVEVEQAIEMIQAFLNG